MTYEEKFYISGNIIGYTGDIDSNPTVYFLNGNRFGRITQSHSDKDNIGRNKVREYSDYKIENNKDEKAQEYYNGKTRHTSRSKFIKVTEGTRSKLANAIAAFKCLKPKYGK